MNESLFWQVSGDVQLAYCNDKEGWNGWIVQIDSLGNAFDWKIGEEYSLDINFPGMDQLLHIKLAAPIQTGISSASGELSSNVLLGIKGNLVWGTGPDTRIFEVKLPDIKIDRGYEEYKSPLQLAEKALGKPIIKDNNWDNTHVAVEEPVLNTFMEDLKKFFPSGNF